MGDLIPLHPKVTLSEQLEKLILDICCDDEGILDLNALSICIADIERAKFNLLAEYGDYYGGYDYDE